VEVEMTLEKEFLTPEEAAQLLDVHVDTIREWLRCSPPKLPGTKIGDLWRIKRCDIDALFARKEDL
jgi:excisionase family DNA binding protein